MGSTAIYKAFIKAGVDEDTAMAAANDIATGAYDTHTGTYTILIEELWG